MLYAIELTIEDFMVHIIDEIFMNKDTCCIDLFLIYHIAWNFTNLDYCIPVRTQERSVYVHNPRMSYCDRPVGVNLNNSYIFLFLFLGNPISNFLCFSLSKRNGRVFLKELLITVLFNKYAYLLLWKCLILWNPWRSINKTHSITLILGK